MRMLKCIAVFFMVAVGLASVDAKVQLKAQNSKFRVQDNPPSVSQQVINTFFSVALDSLSNAAPGYSPILDPANYYFEVSSTGTPVDITAFNGTTTFINPTGPTDNTQAEHFVELVNHNHVVSNIEGTYWNILQSAAASPDTDTSTKQSYIDACNYLFADGVNKTVYSAVFKNYLTLRSAYQAAYIAYQTASATLTAAQFYIQGPQLQVNMANAQEALSLVSTQVEDAENTIATTGASLSATVFADAIAGFKSSAITSVIRGLSFSTVTNNPSFHYVFPQPADWATNDNDWTHLSITADNVASSTSSSYSSWASSGNAFFFSYSAGGSTTSNHYQAEATDLTLTLEYVLVELDRPWLDDTVFQLSSWRLPGQAVGTVSNGQAAQTSGLFPAYTSHLIIVKNLSIQATWTANDNTYISRQVHGGGGFGFGCFTLAGGSYQDGSTQSTQTVQFQNTVLTASGAQIIGYVQKIIPNSPPLA